MPTEQTATVTHCIHCKQELRSNSDGTDQWLEDSQGRDTCPDDSGELWAHEADQRAVVR